MAYTSMPRSRDDFEVGIVCALTIESDAVEALFDTIWENEGSYRQASGDPNAYTIGKICGFNVVLAYLSEMGNTSSAIAATWLRSTFPNIKVALLVGICGAVPFKPNGEEILLGDVIISTGVVRADYGRQLPNKLERKNTLEDNLGRPTQESRAFLKKMQGLRATESLRDTAQQHLTHLLAKQDFHRSKKPDLTEDRLYEATYRHKHHDFVSCLTCAQSSDEEGEVCDIAKEVSCIELECDDKMLVPRRRLQEAIKVEKGVGNLQAEEKYAFHIHFGRMASGNFVMKSGKHRDEFAAKEWVIAFEMEAGGVWDSFPTIVVKSVCDYADSHKNKRWQGFAAANAASCMKALLKEWGVIHRPSEPVLGMVVESNALYRFNLADQYLERILRDRTTREQYFEGLGSREAWQVVKHDTGIEQTLLPSISDYECEKTYRRLIRKHVPITGEWFLNHYNLRSWVESRTKSFLWCSGSLGSGKTMICTKLIQFLKRKSLETDDPVIFFYCDSSQKKTLSATYLLESVLKQILDYMLATHRKLPLKIRHKIQRFYSASSVAPDLDDISDMLLEVFLEIPRAWYIIDGLDEFPTNEIAQVLDHLNAIFQHGSAQKLFIASREELGQNVKIPFELRVQLQGEDTNKDILLYIDFEISRKTAQMRVITDNSEILEEIRKQLFEKAKGM